MGGVDQVEAKEDRLTKNPTAVSQEARLFLHLYWLLLVGDSQESISGSQAASA